MKKLETLLESERDVNKMYRASSPLNPIRSVRTVQDAKKALEDLGWEWFGEGTYSEVWENPDDEKYLIKINTLKKDRAFRQYARLAYLNWKDGGIQNPHILKVKPIRWLKNRFIIAVERLEPLDEDDPFVDRLFRPFTGAFDHDRSEETGIHQDRRGRLNIFELARLYRTGDENNYLRKFYQTYPQMKDALDMVNVASSKRFLGSATFDLSTDNWGVRDGSVPVMLDPIAN